MSKTIAKMNQFEAKGLKEQLKGKSSKTAKSDR